MTVAEANAMLKEFETAVELYTLARSTGKDADPATKRMRKENLEDARKKLVLALIESEV